ncbi:hypothetical protein [Allorhodopirellula solitaria]|uniref:Uncharacterized protein n=1 Tax=Allorhodopirellula solitaria TaxID=2527987 RepID=A0A5C5YJC1_9BACT|nr:hypothetical protein [Allorhodopirellula solitaria]TWT74971.1 hypothetical protein CA85_02590 [Allorhodopirellula solitaria]
MRCTASLWLPASFVLVLSIAVLVLDRRILLDVGLANTTRACDQAGQHGYNSIQRSIQFAVTIIFPPVSRCKVVLDHGTFQR